LPSLASTKESKLSKHTIVDESLKYHELQQKKLDELQRSFDALTAEKEELLAEVVGWRQVLDVQPQTVPAELYEPNLLQNAGPPATVNNPSLLYGDATASGRNRPLVVPEMAKVPGSDLLPVDFFDDYTKVTQPSQTHFQDDPDVPDIPVTAQHFTQDGDHVEPPLTNLWPPPQPMVWTDQSFHDVPLNFH
jgi:hypothetical protein